MRIARFTMLAVLLAFGLSACGATDSLTFWRKEKPEPCPRITVLRDAANITQFKDGPGRDIIDVLYEAHVTNVLSACKYDVDYDTRAGTINIQLAPVIAAKRGPADQVRLADVTYFIAVVNSDKKILQKKTFDLKLGFPGNLTQNEVRDEPVELSIATNGSTDGRDYEVYVGFQMTREQMAYTRRLNQR